MTATPERPARPVTAADGHRATDGPGEPAGRPPSAIARHKHWLRLLAGIFGIALGIAAFAWPEATVQVVAVLFGLHLVVIGLVRAGTSLFLTSYSLVYRVLGVVFGVLTGLIGILCMRNLTGSLVLLLVFVALGWLLDGLTQIALSIGGPAEERGGAGFATGLISVLGAIVILVWPKIGLGVFIFFGATVLVFVGIGAVISAIGGMRTHHG